MSGTASESHEWVGTERDGTAHLRCAKCSLTLSYTLTCTTWQPPVMPPTPDARSAREQVDHERRLEQVAIDAMREVDRQLSVAIFATEEIHQLDLMLELSSLRAQLSVTRDRPRFPKGLAP